MRTYWLIVSKLNHFYVETCGMVAGEKVPLMFEKKKTAEMYMRDWSLEKTHEPQQVEFYDYEEEEEITEH